MIPSFQALGRVNYPALLAASVIVSVLALALVGVPIKLIWNPVFSADFVALLIQDLGLAVGACLIAFTIVLSPLSARTEAGLSSYLEASIKSVGWLYIICHLVFSVRALVTATWVGVLLGPLAYAIYPILYGLALRAGAGLGGLFLVGLFGAPAVGWLYWRFSQRSWFSRIELDPRHARAAVVAAGASAVASAVGSLVTFGMLGLSFLNATGLLIIVAHIPLEAISALAFFTFGACGAAYLQMRSTRRLEYLGWIALFATISVVTAVSLQVLTFSLRAALTPGAPTITNHFNPWIFAFTAPRIIVDCVGAYVYARCVGATRWGWSSSLPATK